MTNPDNNTNVLSTMPSPLFNLLAVVLIILLFGLFFTLANSYEKLYSLFIWVLFPILSYGFTFGMNIWNQYIHCNEINLKMSALGALPMIGTIYAALLISLIPFCRIPIISIIGPLFYNKEATDDININMSNKNAIKSRIKDYSPSKMTLEEIENNSNNGYIIKGIAISFYLIFGVMFGNVFSFGISSIC
jgi:hypothetical protein